MIFHPMLFDDLAMVPRACSRMQKVNPPNVSYDIIDHKNEVRISVDLPGVKKGDIALTTEDGTITIDASDGAATKKTRISKSFTVDHQTIDLAKIKANLADGVLVLTAPKQTKPEPRIIAIREGPHETPILAFDKKEDDDTNENAEEPGDEKESDDTKTPGSSTRKEKKTQD